jgi:hypothetical protein
MQAGTEFVDAVTGLIYVPHEPTKLGGFFIFATLAFLGQVLLYSAFQRAFPATRLKWYAALIFFFPNLLFWPASIGKDSLMLLFIGVSAYGAVRLLVEYRARWITLFGVGLAGCAAIRSHIALALAVALLVALVVSRSSTAAQPMRRLTSIIIVSVVLVAVGRVAIQSFGIDPSAQINQALLEEVIDPIFGGVEEQTAKGGSAVAGTAVRSPADIPSAVMRVVFRPLPTDAHNAQSLANSLVEGTLLLALFVWRGPAIIKRLVRMWRDPYVLFSLVYTAGFIYGHSAILNLGIMARQRSQVIPFVLVLLVALGFSPSARDEERTGFGVPTDQDRAKADRDPALTPLSAE